MTDYYRVLQLKNREQSTRDEIASAFRQLAKQSHPDKGGDPVYFNLLVTAFKVLINPDTRREHDTVIEPQKLPHELKNNKDDLTAIPVYNRNLDSLFDEANAKTHINATDDEYIRKEKRKLRKLKKEIRVKRIIPEFSPNVFNRCFEYAKANSGALTTRRPGTVTECNRGGAEYTLDVLDTNLDQGFIASEIPSEKITHFAKKKPITDKHRVITDKDRSAAKTRMSEYTSFTIC